MAQTLRERLIGAWKLESYVEKPIDGSAPFYPMAEKPEGQRRCVVRGELPVARSDWFHAEAERAKKRHSGNEAEATIELLQRSRDMPNQRARLITITAANIIAVSRWPSHNPSRPVVTPKFVPKYFD